MIKVEALTKKFGITLAVDGITFEIPRGQVVGFLGPNGAGKTTTMRVLTGYLPPDDGQAELMGHNLVENSLDVRRMLGYLPENNPLPDDIETTDYLHFIARLRGIHDPLERRQRVSDVLRRCSLKQAIGKKLGELSKGYRQRVGLAQAIVHDPSLLILDEPTSGLDPNQVQEVRGLIQELKKQKTVLLSTHILSEVQHSCDRVLIINKGKIVADGTPNDLAGNMQTVNKLFVVLRGPQETIEHELRAMDGVLRVTPSRRKEEDGYTVESEAARDLREDVFRLAAARSWPILALSQEKLSLEEVFRALTRATPEPGRPS